jgi:hypothetical protein
MANAMKAGWQDVDEEAANELASGEPHDLIAARDLRRGSSCI